MTTKTAGQQLCEEIDALVAERSLLQHPFYQTWQAGDLTVDALRGYACQYYHHVLQFPTYVSGAHANCDDLEDRQELLENLIEEEHGDDHHPELWLRFGEGIGLTREQMIESTPFPETTSLIETFRKNTKDVPFTAGVSALYAYESQVPDVAGTKMDGLKSFYGIDDPQTLKFFIVHHSLDVEHSRVTRDLIAKYGEDEAEHEKALDAVDKVTAALWSFLDGVHEEYVAGAEATIPA